MSGIGDAFRPFGKDYDAHTPAAVSADKELEAERERRVSAETILEHYWNQCFDEERRWEGSAICACYKCSAVAAHRAKYGEGK